MKQAVMTSPGVIEFRDVPVPKPGPDEVLIRVRRIGVCGSDIHVRHGRPPFTSYSVVQGHELTLTGTLMYQKRDFVKAVRLMRSGALVTAPLETVHFPFAEYRAAYDYADREGERSMKIFVDLETL